MVSSSKELDKEKKEIRKQKASTTIHIFLFFPVMFCAFVVLTGKDDFMRYTKVKGVLVWSGLGRQFTLVHL